MDVLKRYQPKIDLLSMKYLADIRRIKKIILIYLNINQISADRSQSRILEK